MDLGKETSPYYRLRNEDPIEWHLWKQSTVDLARRKNKDLRVVIGSYYSQDAHFLENSRYRDQAFARSLNDTFINVVVDRDEIPAFEHFHRSILIWFLNTFEASTLFFNLANLPLVVVLDGHSLFPKALRNEMLLLDVELHFGANPRHKLIASEQNTGSDQGKVIQFPQRQKSDLEITFADYIENVLERDSPLTDESSVEFWTELESIRSDTHPTGSGLIQNVVKHGKIAAYLIHHARLPSNENKGALDLAAAMLTRLARSPLFDHLAGGFFQSQVAATDAIPAGEKRLTVSAYLLEVYCEALKVADDPLFETVVQLTANFLKDQVTSENTFPTTIADLSQLGASHYAWNKLTLKRLLTEDEFLLMETLYGLDRRPNYQRSYLLERQDSWVSVVDRLFLEPEQALERHESARQKMLEAREDSELVADDRVNPLTCAAVSKALVIAATTLGDKDYFDVAKRVMNALIEKVRFGSVGKDLDEAEVDSDTVVLMPVDAVFIIDALLVLLEYEWDSRLYKMAVDLWDCLIGQGVNELSQTYHKPQFVGSDKPEDFATVPDFFPIFDYQNDRPPETSILIDVARKMATLSRNDSCWDIHYNQLEVLQNSIEHNQVEHIEYIQQIESAEISHTSIVLRGLLDECRSWKQQLSVPKDMNCRVYVIPYDLGDELELTLGYLQNDIEAKTKFLVIAFLRKQGQQIRTFTDLKEVNDCLKRKDD